MKKEKDGRDAASVGGTIRFRAGLGPAQAQLGTWEDHNFNARYISMASSI